MPHVLPCPTQRHDDGLYERDYAPAFATASSRWASTRAGLPETITSTVPVRTAVCLLTLLHQSVVKVSSWLHRSSPSRGAGTF